MDIYYVIKEPLVTEKVTLQKGEANRYCFSVNPDATKVDIRRAVEILFKVKVTDVRTVTLHGKPRFNARARRTIPAQKWKKAIVTLIKGNKIDLFEGV
jgi:large subunit ribosomal protein L23